MEANGEVWTDWARRWGKTREPRQATTTVDVHSHLLVPSSAEIAMPHFRPEMDPRTLYSNEESKQLNRRFFEVVHDKFTDPEARIADMDAMGVDVQLVSIAPPHYFYWLDEDLAPKVASMQNERIAEVVASHPRRFAGSGTLPMAHPAAAVEEAKRIHGELAFRAVEIGTDVNGVDLDHPMFEPVWEVLEELEMAVVLHPAGFTEGRRLGDYYLVNVIGIPISSTVAVSRMILGGVFERHPGLRMLVVHGGGYLPFYIARTDHAFKHRPEMRIHIDRPPSEYLARLWFDTTVFDPAMLEYLVHRYGADRVCLGTDYPFDMGLPDPLALIADARLTAAERRQMVGENALGLFQIQTETAGA